MVLVWWEWSKFLIFGVTNLNKVYACATTMIKYFGIHCWQNWRSYVIYQWSECWICSSRGMQQWANRGYFGWWAYNMMMCRSQTCMVIVNQYWSSPINTLLLLIIYIWFIVCYILKLSFIWNKVFLNSHDYLCIRYIWLHLLS